VLEAWSHVVAVARNAGGHARLEAAPLEARRTRDVFGEAPEGLSIFRELKKRFDPAGILNPGRFSGGI
jgi:glycolate oxidase FAD binding subunit